VKGRPPGRPLTFPLGATGLGFDSRSERDDETRRDGLFKRRGYKGARHDTQPLTGKPVADGHAATVN